MISLCWNLTQRVGGLSASFRDSMGFTWDQGVHLHFSHYDKYDRFLDEVLPSDEWLRLDRSAKAQIGDVLVPYPIQFHLHHLPKEIRWECLQGLLKVREQPRRKPSNFREWVEQTFGLGLAHHFLQRYNEKLWAHPLNQLSWQWVGERVAIPELNPVLKRMCLDEDRHDWGPNAHFRYPRSGGSGRLWSEAVQRLPQDRLRTDDEVMEIDADGKLITTRKGKCYRYRNLISTMPLDVLLRKLKTRRTLPSAARLAKTSTQLVGLGIRGSLPDELRDLIWAYFPDSEASFYRMTILSNLAPEMVPEPERHWSILAEIASSDWRNPSEEEPVKRVVSDLKRMGYLQDEHDLESFWERNLAYGYPVPTLERDRILGDVLPILEELEIYSRGRFGAWKYEVSNQDHSFMQGVEAVERLVSGREELTLFQPDLINGRRNPFPYPEWTDSVSQTSVRIR